MKRLVLLEQNEQWGKGIGCEFERGKKQIILDLMAVIENLDDTDSEW